MKQSFLSVLFAMGFLLAGLGADWPQYRGTNHDGVSSETGILKKWPSGGPRVVWKIPIGEAFGSFAVSGKRAYAMVERDGKEVCLALDADTGKEVWHRAIDKTIFENQGGNGPRTTPAVDDDRIYVLGTYLKLACLKASNGEVLWMQDLVKDFGAQFPPAIAKWGNAASPVVDERRVYVGGGGSGQAFLAFDKMSGALAWKGQTERITHATPAPATIGGVRQIIYFVESGLVSLSAEKGQELWRYKFPFRISTAASPIVAGDIVYCSAGYGVGGGAVKLARSGDRFSATELWRIDGDEAVANHWSTPVHFNGHLYGLFGFKQTGYWLKCIDIQTGKEAWKGEEFGSGGCIVVDGMVLVQGARGELVLAEARPDGYKELARAQPLVGKSWTMAIVSGGRIYARSSNQAICLDVSGK